MRRALALLLLALTAAGAGYEWGGPARRGVLDLRAGRFDEALRELREGRADFPGASVIPYDEALALLGKGQADSAGTRFQEAMRLRGDRPREAAAYNLGNLAMRAKDYPRAARSYREALRLQPADVDAKKNLEEALRRMRQPNSADRRSPPSGGAGPPTPGGAERSMPKPEPGGRGNRGDRGQTPPPRGSSGEFTKEEAERWLQALESERRARRQEGKGQPEQETGNRDW
jgi:Ca-activated chloride channel family protein